MFLKQADDKTAQIKLLECLLKEAPEDRKFRIAEELRSMRAGIKAEKEAAYLINFAFEKSRNTAIIHDLRLQIDGRVAQIDHILLHRTLRIFVLETKYFHSGIKITEAGEFLKWNDFKKKFEGMPSPFAQNERHIAVLKDGFSLIEMPIRFGFRLSPSFYSYVLVSTNTRIDRPEFFDTNSIIKADMIKSTVESHLESTGLVDSFGNAARILSSDSLEKVGRRLIELHDPISIDYKAKFGLARKITAASILQNNSFKVSLPTDSEKKYHCYKCNGTNLHVQYKYSYYFKCIECQSNTRIKLTCGIDGHKNKIRKEGAKFFFECETCDSSFLFFENPD